MRLYYKAIGVPIVIILVIIIVFILWYLISQQGKELYRIDNNEYIIKIIKYPSGFGTVNYLRVYSYEKSRDFESKLLVNRDAIDSADVAFIDSSTVQVLLLKRFESVQWGSYWHTTDSIVFNLD